MQDNPPQPNSQDNVFNQLRKYIEENDAEKLNDFLSNKKNNEFDINHIQHEESSDITGNKIERCTLRKTQQTLLHIAIRCRNSSKPILEILINHYADPNIPYNAHETRSIQHCDGYEGRPTSDETTEEPVETIYTPVELACKEGHLDVAKYLVHQGGLFNQKQIRPEHYLELAPQQILYLQEKDQQAKLLEDKLAGLEKVQELYQKDSYKISTSSGSHLNKILKIQALTRGGQSRERVTRNELKRQKLEDTEKLGTEVVGQLMKRQRFSTAKDVCDMMINSNPLDTHTNLFAENENLKNEIKADSFYLLLGEGNFSFALSLVTLLNAKHSGVSRKFIASDNQTFNDLEKIHESKFTHNISTLEQSKNVTLFENIDAQTINQNENLQKISNRFHKIYFNNPHDGKNYKQQSIPKILSNFFKAARNIQQPGDKIHIILPKDPDKDKRDWRYAKCYDIYPLATEFGYIYHRKYGEIAKRYPEYQSTKTTSSDNVFETKDLREHVFMRSDYCSSSAEWLTPPGFFKHEKCLPETETLDPSFPDTPQTFPNFSQTLD